MSPDVVAWPGTHVCCRARDKVEVCTSRLIGPRRSQGIEGLVLQAAAGAAEIKGRWNGGEEVGVDMVEGEGVDDFENDIHCCYWCCCCGIRGVVGKEMLIVPTRRVDGGAIECANPISLFESEDTILCFCVSAKYGTDVRSDRRKGS